MDSLVTYAEREIVVESAYISERPVYTVDAMAMLGVAKVHAPGYGIGNNYSVDAYIGSEETVQNFGASDCRDAARFFIELAEALEMKDAQYENR